MRIVRNSRGHDWLDDLVGREFVIACEDGFGDAPGWSGKGSDAGGYWWPEVDIVRVPTTTPPTNFIVARLTSKGEPRPNVRPRVHATLEAANEEAQRLADRLGDEFAVYQRVSTRTVDAGPVPNSPGWPFRPELARQWVAQGNATNGAASAFDWSRDKRGWAFWGDQAQASSGLTHLGRAILRKWIAEAETATTKEAA